MKNLVMICLVMLYNITSAQTFKKEAEIKPVQQDGYYKIILTPEVTSQLNEDFSDIRVFDNNGKEIPYLLQKEVPLQNHELFREYEIIENTSKPKVSSQLILHNSAKSKINNISLLINNSEARKKAKLTGSDDKQNWYIIKENFILESINNTVETAEIKIVDFPLSNYEYFKIEINDSTSEPLKINKAGYYDSYTEYGKFLKVPSFSIQQKDSSNKISYIKFTLNEAQYLDRLKLTIQGPELYRRQASICLLQKHKHRPYFNTIQEVEIRSGQENIIYLDHFKAKEFYLLVENKDNTPLKISAEGFQIMNYLLANLIKDNTYKIKFGNKNLTSPSYDLEYFRDNLPNPVADLYPENFSGKEELKQAQNESFFKSQLWIWGAIIVVIALLGFMTNKMVKEMKKEAV